jgi:hypothetical protein
MAYPPQCRIDGMNIRVWSWSSLSDAGKEAWVCRFACDFLDEQQLSCPRSLRERTIGALYQWREELTITAESLSEQPHREPIIGDSVAQEKPSDFALRSITSDLRPLAATEVRECLSEWDQMTDLEQSAMIYRMAIAHRLNNGRSVPGGMLMKMEALCALQGDGY